eukprot:4583012-Pleurochrysis_carterae.AAC.1
MAPGAWPHAGRLRSAQCTHSTGGHDAVAYGRDADGRSRAKAAAAYPPPLNHAQADMLAAAAGSSIGATRPGAAGADAADGGRITDGPQLSAYVRAHV